MYVCNAHPEEYNARQFQVCNTKLCVQDKVIHPQELLTLERIKLNSQFSIKSRTYFHPQNLESEKNNI